MLPNGAEVIFVPIKTGEGTTSSTLGIHYLVQPLYIEVVKNLVVKKKKKRSRECVGFMLPCVYACSIYYAYVYIRIDGILIFWQFLIFIYCAISASQLNRCVCVAKVFEFCFECFYVNLLYNLIIGDIILKFSNSCLFKSTRLFYWISFHFHFSNTLQLKSHFYIFSCVKIRILFNDFLVYFLEMKIVEKINRIEFLLYANKQCKQ